MTYTPTLEDARRLAAQGNMIPVYREMPADLETPVSVYLKLRKNNSGPSFLLESVERGEQLGRYSFIGVHPPMSVVAYGSEVTVGAAGGAVLSQQSGDPMQIVASMNADLKPVKLPGLPLFSGGVCGAFGYDLVRFMERLPETAERVLDVPDMVLLFSDNLVVFDHVRHKLIIIANMRVPQHANGELVSAYADAVARIDGIVQELRQALTPPVPVDVSSGDIWESNMSLEYYEEMIASAKEYISAGDIFQVVLSQRLSRRTKAEPFAIYRSLRMLNPSPYMYYLDFAGVAGLRGEPLRIIGSSPEMHVRIQEQEGERFASLHPIAGTRWRGATPDDDRRLAEELLADPKERAEHVMLVDLGRNDLGRVSEYGSVVVPQMMQVERYSHVMHIVSDVRGKLRPGMDAWALLRATFPAGTLSGAPKVRAMEIIEELEGTRRGLYGGAVGYVGYDGQMDTCITIRTVVMQGKQCYLQAGGGIVADSDAEYEFNESMNKARALAVAVEYAERGV